MEDEIQSEYDTCQAAFEGISIGALVQHCHHERWLEVLTEPAEKRIHFIVANKLKEEQAVRLHLFRPLAYADWKKADADCKKAYADWKKTDADCKKADADWEKADADWKKADADCKKAYADWEKAYADFKKAEDSPAMQALHKNICGCPWSDKTDIFGEPR